MKRAFVWLLLCLMMQLPVAATATETTQNTEPEAVTRAPGQCGEDLYWSYDNGTLIISGSGDMDDYEEGAPWLEYKDSITEVVFSGDVTSVGACAFMDYDNLKSVAFGNSMHTVGYRAFKSCDGLMEISLPASFRKFGEESFMGCKILTTIWCNGGMPSFKGNCLWDVYATLYYPANNPWPIDPVIQLQNAFQHRVIIVMGSTMDFDRAPALEKKVTVPEPTVPVATEAVATEPAVTVPQTVPEETVESTVPQTIPETTQQTQPETQPETQPPTEPETQPHPWEDTQPTQPAVRRSRLNGIRIGVVLIGGVLSFLILGMLLFRRSGR